MGRSVKCGECGSDLPEDSIHCSVCGAKVGDDQEDVASYSKLPFGAVVTCPKCGARNSRTDRWCGACDADLDAAKRKSTLSAPKGPDCPKCGVVNHAGANYCRKCGNPLTEDARLRRKGPIDMLPVVLGDSEGGAGVSLGGSSPTHQHVIIRERQVVMIRCKYCGTLNGPDDKNCSSCGAQM